VTIDGSVDVGVMGGSPREKHDAAEIRAATNCSVATRRDYADEAIGFFGWRTRRPPLGPRRLITFGRAVRGGSLARLRTWLGLGSVRRMLLGS